MNREVEIGPAAGDEVAVRIPLAEPPGSWVKHFLPTAHAEHISAEVQETPDGLFLIVRVPAAGTREETFALLDAAVALIEKAKATDEKQSASFTAARRHVTDWWSEQRR